jgi:hypothetical protein
MAMVEVEGFMVQGIKYTNFGRVSKVRSCGVFRVGGTRFTDRDF